MWDDVWKFGACGSVVVKALCYKPEGRVFVTQWGGFENLEVIGIYISENNAHKYTPNLSNGGYSGQLW
jgi:hypothetical protein